MDLGIVRPGQTIYIPFTSYASSTGASITLTGLATSDILVYKDGGTTQRASTNGYTLLDTDGIDFDGVTGLHGISIDLADNSTAGFYAAGSRYFVAISTVTVDSQTVTFLAAQFRIGYPAAILNTTIATLSSQTSFTLTAGPAEDDALNGMWVMIHDVASAVQAGYAEILDYTGSTKTVTLAAGTTFTAAATDNIAVMGPAPVKPTVTGRTLDVSSGGEAGVDWANVGSPTTSQTLSGTTVGTATAVTTVNGLAANVITATAIQNDAITAAKIATGAIDADAIADNAIDAGALAASAGDYIADKVWDESLSGHLALDTFGQYLQPLWTTIVTAATSTTVTLNSGSQPDDFFNGQYVRTVGGTGEGQVRRIVDWVSSTKVLTVTPAWTTNPDTSTEVVILPHRAEADGSGLTATDVWAAATRTITGGTITTYTGDTPQSGDAFARLGAPAGASVSADIAGVQSDTNDLQTRVPAALVSGRIDASVGAMAANVLTAAATAADFTTEVTAGLATAANVAAVETDTQDIQSRLPAALVSGRIDSSVGAMAANVMTAAAAAADLTTELQSGLATGSAVSAIDTKLGTPAGASVSADIAAIEAQTDDIGTAGAGLTAVPWNAAWDAEVQSECADALSAFGPATAAQVATEISDALRTDTLSELAQAAPAATPTIAEALMLLYMALRNQVTQTSATRTIANDAGTVICKATTSDNGTTYTRTELVAGP